MNRCGMCLALVRYCECLAQIHRVPVVSQAKEKLTSAAKNKIVDGCVLRFLRRQSIASATDIWKGISRTRSKVTHEDVQKSLQRLRKQELVERNMDIDCNLRLFRTREWVLTGEAW